MTEPEPRLPNFLILGAQKSGTTSLARWLERHPEVYVPPRKELHFFAGDDDRGADWYREQFALSGSATAVGEATPEYLYRPEAPARVHDLLGADVRLIAMLRNPIDRAYSNFWHARALGQGATTFEAALDAEDLELARERSGWAALVDRGCYLRQLQRWERRFGREQLHVEIFDDLLEQPLGVLQRVWTFLGVDPAVVKQEQFAPRNRAVRSRLPRPIAAQVQRLPVGSATRVWIKRHTTVALTPPPMHPETRERLGRTFRRENQALGVWLGRDLSAWT